MKRVVLLLLILWGVSKFCLKQTDGFALNKISEELLEVSASEIDETLLQEPYHYLSKGGQSYVFLSRDGTCVLKFFRGSKLNSLRFLYSLIPLTYFEKKISSEKRHLMQTLQSYALAQKHLKQETGILGIHLHASATLHKQVILIDKLGIEHKIDPNSYPFIIQKRATLVKQTIDQLVEKNDYDSARNALKALFSLLQKRVEKGIEDSDPNLTKNFGFCGSDPIQIDGGRFSLIADSKVGSEEKILRSKEDLQNWINQKHPELSKDLQLFYEDFLNEAL